jgi:hypothetical protein
MGGVMLMCIVSDCGVCISATRQFNWGGGGEFSKRKCIIVLYLLLRVLKV